MPQWDFLNFLAAHGRRYRGFHLMMNTEATDLVFEGERVTGVRARRTAPRSRSTPISWSPPTAAIRPCASGPASPWKTSARRWTCLWMRLSRRPEDPTEAFGHIEAGRFFIMLDRGDYWQCAYVISKGSADTLMKRPIADFRAIILELSPWLDDRVNELKSWDDVKLLTVAVDRLKQWYRPGLLCIGDAAHAMSPVGGVGINLAVQDAVAAANILYEPLRDARRDARRPAQGRGTPRMADAGDPAHPDLHPEPRDQRGAGGHAAAEAASSW